MKEENNDITQEWCGEEDADVIEDFTKLQEIFDTAETYYGFQNMLDLNYFKTLYSYLEKGYRLATYHKKRLNNAYTFLKSFTDKEDQRMRDHLASKKEEEEMEKA